MSISNEHLNPISVLDAVITDMRATGDTGHVENLLQARAAFANAIETLRRIGTYPKTRADELSAESMRRLASDAISRIGAV